MLHHYMRMLITLQAALSSSCICHIKALLASSHSTVSHTSRPLTPSLQVPATTQPPPGYVVHAEIQLEVPVEHGLLIENLLDLAHAPFTHQATFAKGWPVPDVVKFHAQRMLSGQWDPYPIEMAFQPPCMVRCCCCCCCCKLVYKLEASHLMWFLSLSHVALA
jgi:hypothetical protein